MRKVVLFLSCFLILVGCESLFQEQSEEGILRVHNVANKDTALQTKAFFQQAVLPSADSKPITSTKRFVVVIDPGHQKKANLEKEPIGPGATETKMKVSGGTTGTTTGKPEYQLTLEASLLLKTVLEERGIDVFLTRESNDVNISNRERAEYANHQEADLFIRMHADGSTNQRVRGFHILVPAQNGTYTKEIYETSLQASEVILDVLKEDSTVAVRGEGVSFREDITGFNWSSVTTILLELGYMTNPEDDRNLSNPEYLLHLMNQLATGIERFASDLGKE
ncbi:N-acetylmuramoyl-L-alanine amidase [Bacillus sp. BGMRC 2118]|nr:N-acetylmuramoyl-L-alanine amidase [Bacillus sp. BGMRC 2118]